MTVENRLRTDLGTGSEPHLGHSRWKISADLFCRWALV